MGDDAVKKKRRPSSLLHLHFLGPHGVAFAALTLVAFLHLVALWVFSRGFLLHRVALPDRTTCTDCTLKPRYDRLIVLIVDALRDDFLLPFDTTAPGLSPHYHNILTTPATLSAQKSGLYARSFRFVADPPTTTLQRLKGLTVGTLPTFVDAGSNFAGSEAEEDSWLEQAQRAGKRIAFMGDDTWLTVFPPATGVFSPNQTWPYDSFNVEDLDTVDRGVVEHLYPLLDQPRGEGWDILVGHFLGLDHVGHRLGPNHAEMTRKLREAEEVVQTVVGKMAKGDLLVLMGDHGMDDHGDHGGDSQLEVNAGLFYYSPGIPLAPTTLRPASAADPRFFMRNGKHFRSVQQISLVPTLSLLLGLPIPFSNLGSLVPELFTSSDLAKATKLNADQVAAFLRTYTARDPAAELAQAAPRLLQLYEQATTIEAEQAFLDETLRLSRAVWATFDMRGMLAGLALLLGGTLCAARLFSLAGRDGALWRTGAARVVVGYGVAGSVVGAIIGVLASLALFPTTLSKPRLVAGVAAMGAELAMFLAPGPPFFTSRTSWTSTIFGVIPLLHLAIFGSNSFVVFEDRVVLLLLITCILLLPLRVLRATDRRLRNRVIGFSVAAAVLVRLAAVARLCREEQQGGDICTTTFYGHDGIWLVASLCCSLVLPSLIVRFLSIARADGGLAKPLLNGGLRLSMLCATAYWSLEYRNAPSVLKNAFAWSSYGVSVIVLTAWWGNPLTLRVEKLDAGRRAIIGFANTFGSSYLVFASFLFALVYTVTLPAGHAALTFGFVALLCLIEALDSVRDATGVSSTVGPALHELALLPLCAHALYFATGHQATLPSLQWKVAFVGFSTVTYPFAPLLIALNTLGPLSLLPTLCAPLFALWNVSPPAPGPNAVTTTSLPVLRRTLRSLLGVITIYAALATVAAAFAAYFRRHLMVWKVFAPRFMLAAVALVGVDVCAVVVVWSVGVTRVLGRVKRTFGTEWA